jgi:signal transduction histidine kinase
VSGAGIPGQPIYQLLLATLLTTLFFSLLSWRSFRERRAGLGRLRSFVARRGRYEGLLRSSAAQEPHASSAALTPLQALCGELLGASTAYLVPLGPLAALAGPPLAIPSDAEPPVAAAAALAATLPPQPPLVLPVVPEAHGGAVWAVPLRGDQGLAGLLLLGEKRDGGLYTEEEIALARDTAEDLIDDRAAAEMGRRLVALQRRRLAEGQVLDRRARRLLHDEVLPLIHSTLLQVAHAQQQSPADAAASSPLQAAICNLQAAHRQISDLLHDLLPAAGAELERYGPLGALRRALDEELADAFDTVRWEVSPSADTAARSLDSLQAESLYYAAREAARNAARHGRGGDNGRALTLRVAAPDCAATPRLILVVEDDGVGTLHEATDSGAGAGLSLHGTILTILGGSFELQSPRGGPTRVTISLPIEPPVQHNAG